MKKIIFSLFYTLFIVVLFSCIGCKEEHSLVTLTSIVSKDTTYVFSLDSIPAATPHQVLIEDFTGVTCTNCPVAHDEVLVPIINSNPGRVNVIEYFISDWPQTAPNAGQVYDGFRSKVALSISNNIFLGLSLIPCAGIDRLPPGNLLLTKDIWISNVNARLPVIDSLNLSISSTYDATTKSAKIIAQITYLQPTTAAQNLSIAVVEDGLVDLQEFPNPTPVHNITFDGVFKNMVTTVPFGDPIFPGITKERGRFCQKVYTYKLDSNIVNPKNCRLIAFVAGDQSVGGVHVYQSCQAKLIP